MIDVDLDATKQTVPMMRVATSAGPAYAEQRDKPNQSIAMSATIFAGVRHESRAGVRDSVVIAAKHHCFDAKTEIITANGWKRFSELRMESVGQVDPQSLELSFITPQQWIHYDYAGPMYHFRTDDVDLLVTPDHRMLVQRAEDFRRTPSAWEFRAAQDLDPQAWYVLPSTCLRPGETLWHDRLTLISPEHRSVEQYDGPVYCVTVPSGAIYVRRNGRSCVSGNCPM